MEGLSLPKNSLGGNPQSRSQKERVIINLLELSDQKPNNTWMALRPRTPQDPPVEGEIQLQLQYKYKPVKILT
jgi:hypothetical protein